MARKPKAVQADNDAPTNGPSDRSIRALNFAKIVRSLDDLDAAKADHDSVVKHAEGKGVDKKAAAIAIKILRQGSAATTAYATLIRNVLDLLDIGGSPVAKSQIDMFEAEEDRTPLDERARKAGRNAAFFDKGTGDNPYDPTSSAGQEWLAGLDEGRVEVDLIKALEPKAGSELIKGDDDSEDPFASVSSIAAE